MTDPLDPLDAGDLSSWIDAMEGALRGENGTDVPCGTCTACCTSRQFVHIGPDETDTLAHIPRELLFPAPRLSLGHLVLGYDEQGRCPMLAEGGCSIYEHRPVTCRTYDCRVFTATGVDPGDDKPAIQDRTRRWRFATPTEADRASLDALRTAAAFLHEHPDQTPDGVAPANATELAVVAVEIHTRFLPGALGPPGPATRRGDVSSS